MSDEKPKRIKVWYKAGDICSAVDQALMRALDAQGYETGDAGTYIGNYPDFVERDLEFVLKGLDDYPYDDEEESYPDPGKAWLRCTLEDYEVEQLFTMIDISLEAAKDTEWEETVSFVMNGLKRKLKKGLTEPRSS